MAAPLLLSGLTPSGASKGMDLLTFKLQLFFIEYYAFLLGLLHQVGEILLMFLFCGTNGEGIICYTSDTTKAVECWGKLFLEYVLI